MKAEILGKIEQHVPKLKGLVAEWRSCGARTTRAVIVSAVLAADVRFLSRDEILYLAWLKADYDQGTREQDELIRKRWLQRREKDASRLRE